MEKTFLCYKGNSRHEMSNVYLSFLLSYLLFTQHQVLFFANKYFAMMHYTSQIFFFSFASTSIQQRCLLFILVGLYLRFDFEHSYTHRSVMQESTPLVPRPGIRISVPDTRETYQKRLAEYLILASVLFERLAFYSLASNLVLYLQSNKINWSSTDSATAVYIFYGK